MYIENDNFINQLRKEANDVKSCFTTFAFQAIAFSVVVLGAIINFQQDRPYVGLAGILVIIVVLTVCRIGNYKYATANRQFGFELFLDFEKSVKRRKLLSQIGWEEAMRAWRVVQATIFDHYYYSRTNTRFYNIIKNLKYNKIRKDRLEENKIKKWWFLPEDYIAKKGKWYPGSYLHTMQDILLKFAYISMIPIFVMILQFQFDPKYNNYFQNFIVIGEIRTLSLAGLLIFIITCLTLFIYRLRILARRHLLEHGILSIHSCAIMWQAVTDAHLKALSKSKNHHNKYLVYLSDEAKTLKTNMNKTYGLNMIIASMKKLNNVTGL